MFVRVVAVAAFCLALQSAGAMAQALPPPGNPPTAEPEPQPPPPPQSPEQEQPARVFCDQNITYHLADPSSVPEQYRRFVGVWSDAAWDARTCAALIVQDVQADGHASIIYILGPEGSESTVSGAVLHGTGVVRDGELRFQNSDGSQYAFRPGLVDMVGHWVDPKGESFQATFKATP
jgi:hypothetical protein